MITPKCYCPLKLLSPSGKGLLIMFGKCENSPSNDQLNILVSPSAGQLWKGLEPRFFFLSYMVLSSYNFHCWPSLSTSQKQSLTLNKKRKNIFWIDSEFKNNSMSTLLPSGMWNWYIKCFLLNMKKKQQWNFTVSIIKCRNHNSLKFTKKDFCDWLFSLWFQFLLWIVSFRKLTRTRS